MLGQFSEVQEQQHRLAHTDHFTSALNTAKNLNLKSELGLALCIDIHVQNGGTESEARAGIQEALAPQARLSEQGLRELIARTVADNVASRFAEDVCSGKLTIARGEGNVHGVHFILENWGLGHICSRACLERGRAT